MGAAHVHTELVHGRAARPARRLPRGGLLRGPVPGLAAAGRVRGLRVTARVAGAVVLGVPPPLEDGAGDEARVGGHVGHDPSLHLRGDEGPKAGRDQLRVGPRDGVAAGGLPRPVRVTEPRATAREAHE